jgi:hypothetical protein
MTDDLPLLNYAHHRQLELIEEARRERLADLARSARPQPPSLVSRVFNRVRGIGRAQTGRLVLDRPSA